MSKLILTKDLQNGEIPTKAGLDAPLTDVEDFVNNAELTAENFQARGITSSSFKTTLGDGTLIDAAPPLTWTDAAITSSQLSADTFGVSGASFAKNSLELTKFNTWELVAPTGVFHFTTAPDGATTFRYKNNLSTRTTSSSTFERLITFSVSFPFARALLIGMQDTTIELITAGGTGATEASVDFCLSDDTTTNTDIACVTYQLGRQNTGTSVSQGTSYAPPNLIQFIYIPSDLTQPEITMVDGLEKKYPELVNPNGNTYNFSIWWRVTGSPVQAAIAAGAPLFVKAII